MSRHHGSIRTLGALGWLLFACVSAQAADQPNILVIMGDDIGIWNVSAYHHGMMGYQHAAISIASPTRARCSRLLRPAELHGRPLGVHHRPAPFRTGLTKVGLPGADLGLRKEDPTIAELLKPLGYVTGQFGKNHLGDRDEFLPTAHGFDEFFGNLYHLNAEEEPENPDYPEEPGVQEEVRPARRAPRAQRGRQEDRGHRPADQAADGNDRRGGPRRGDDFLERAKKADKPFFVWFNTTRMHNFTHVKEGAPARPGLGFMPTA